jgi:hypothetical protein
MSMFLLHIIEDSLQRVHLNALATRVRHLELYLRSSKWQALDWQRRYEQEEHNGTYLIQRELYLNEEVPAYIERAKKQPLTNKEYRQLREWEIELDGFDQIWMRHQRALAQLIQDKPRGMFMKEWEKEHQDSGKQWSKQSYECFDRGGCCERNCGCCARPLVTHRLSELYVYVHCTEACGCCIRYQQENEVRRSKHPRDGFKHTMPVSVQEGDTPSDLELPA